MNLSLNDAARRDSVDDLYVLIQQDPHVLEHVDAIPFVQTPLHEAAKAGCIHFTIEMMRLKPSFTRKLNPDGFSPIHIALQNNKTELVIRMIDVDRELVRVQGRECITPLHYVAEKGNIKLMVEFLLACPEAIVDVNVRKESALHIAVKHNQIDTVKVMLEWIKLLDSEFMLGWTDEKSNNILHIAAAASKKYKDLEMVKMLIPRVDRNAENSTRHKPLDLMQPGARKEVLENKKVWMMQWWEWTISYGNATVYCDTNNNETLAKSLKNGYPWYNRWILSNDRQMSTTDKNGLLVIAVLIATTAYQAVITVPTVFANSIKAPISRNYLLAFQFFNTTTFIAAMSLIYIILPRGFSYMLQLVIPIVMCYFLGIYLTINETYVYMSTLLLFAWQILRYGRVDKNENRRTRHSLLKHRASYSKELEKKGYHYH